MNIFIPTKFTKDGIGGYTVFPKKFKQCAETLGHQVFFKKPKTYDALLVIRKCSFRHLLEAKLRRKTIVQRMDGVCYPAVSGYWWRLLNFYTMIIHNFIADKIIYQSNFSKKNCETFLGRRHPTHSIIIYNGVDLNQFSPTGPRLALKDFTNQKIIIVVSSFRRDEDTRPIFEVGNHLWSQRQDFKIIIVGRLTKYLKHYLKYHSGKKYLQYLGILPNYQLSDYLRSSNVLLFPERSPCPNRIIEALASGLAISACDRGSSRELISNHLSGELSPTSGTIFGQQQINIIQLTRNTSKILDNLYFYQTNARRDAIQKFDINKISLAYLEILQS